MLFRPLSEQASLAGNGEQPTRGRFSPRALSSLLVLSLAVAVFCLTSLTATAAKKPKEEPKEEKSYVLPYLIVISFIGVGLMTICRPSRRLDKVNEKKKKKEEEYRDPRAARIAVPIVPLSYRW